tara:strand:+ start:98 stop:736 length:639 start_codon:yes stop_codon:yes gene_type:complete
MEKMKELLLVIRSFKGWVLVLMFFSGFLWLFNKPIIDYAESNIATKDLVLGNIKNDLLINDGLSELLDNTSADRAYIFRFHNGVTYYTGSHKSRMSCDYEVVSRGISSEAQRLQNIPTALYIDWISEVIANRMIHPDVNKVSDSRARQSLIQQGIKGLAVMPYYREGNLVALIGVDYVTTKDFTKLKGMHLYNETEKQIFKLKTQRIGDLLL